MQLVLAIIVFVIISAVILVALFVKENKSSLANFPEAGTSDGQIVKKSLLTQTEYKFFQLLVSAFPEFYIFPQVSFSALLTHSGKDGYRLRNSFNRSVADFVIVDQSSQVVAVVELDDKSHDKQATKEKDQKRDSLLKQAGYRVARYRCENMPNIQKIRQDLFLETIWK